MAQFEQIIGDITAYEHKPRRLALDMAAYERQSNYTLRGMGVYRGALGVMKGETPSSYYT